MGGGWGAARLSFAIAGVDLVSPHPRAAGRRFRRRTRGVASRACGIALIRPVANPPGVRGAILSLGTPDPGEQRRIFSKYYRYFVADSPPIRNIARLSPRRPMALPLLYGNSLTLYAPCIPDMAIARTDNRADLTF